MQKRILVTLIIALFIVSNVFAINRDVNVLDNFTDGDYTSNPPWTVGAGGGFDASNFQLDHNASGLSGTQQIETPINKDINTKNWFLQYMIKTDGFDNGNAHLMGFRNDANSSYTYGIGWESADVNKGRISLTVNGVNQVAFSDNNFSELNKWYKVEIRRNQDYNKIEVFIDDTLEITYYDATNYEISWFQIINNWGIGAQPDVFSSWDDINYGTFTLRGITGSFSHNINKTDESIDFNDTTTNQDNNFPVTLNDWNWYVDGILKSTNQNWTLTGINQNTDYNTCLSVAGTDDADGNYYSDYICNNVNSGRIYGLLHIDSTDENSLGDVSSLTISFDGNSYTANGDWWHDLNYLGASNSEKTITISKSGYGTRYYTGDFNRFGDYNIPFLMLPDTLDNVGDISLTVYDADGLEIVSNTFVKVLLDGNYIGRRKTNNNGEVNFFLNEVDTNYLFYVEGEYDTNLGNVLIHRPKDEETRNIITGEDWTVSMKTATTDSSPTTVDTNSYSILIIPNKTNYYFFDIDTNSGNYHERRYTAVVRGDQEELGVYEIQPYLLLESKGNSFKITVKEKYKENNLDNALVEVYSTEEGDIKILSFQTDLTGSYDAWLKAGITYFFKVTDKDGIVREFNTKTRGMYNAILGEDIILYVDYSVERSGIRQVLIYPANRISNVGDYGGVYVDAFLWGVYNLESWNVDVTQYSVEVRIYEDGVYNASKSDSGTVSSNVIGIADYDMNFIMDAYDTNYCVEVLIEGERYDYVCMRTLTQSESDRIWSFATSNSLVAFILTIIIITSGLIIGSILGYGLESIFLLSIILVFTGWTSGGVTIVAIMGILYFIMPIIRDYFKE